eukprot:11660241-Alexandrium_andersonii.AAC.1
MTAAPPRRPTSYKATTRNTERRARAAHRPNCQRSATRARSAKRRRPRDSTSAAATTGRHGPWKNRPRAHPPTAPMPLATLPGTRLRGRSSTSAQPAPNLKGKAALRPGLPAHGPLRP